MSETKMKQMNVNKDSCMGKRVYMIQGIRNKRDNVYVCMYMSLTALQHGGVTNNLVKGGKVVEGGGEGRTWNQSVYFRGKCFLLTPS